VQDFVCSDCDQMVETGSEKSEFQLVVAASFSVRIEKCIALANIYQHH
jgi:hypothetical protein